MKSTSILLLCGFAAGCSGGTSSPTVPTLDYGTVEEATMIRSDAMNASVYTEDKTDYVLSEANVIAKQDYSAILLDGSVIGTGASTEMPALSNATYSGSSIVDLLVTGNDAPVSLEGDATVALTIGSDITGQVTLDGFTQTGYTGASVVVSGLSACAADAGAICADSVSMTNMGVTPSASAEVDAIARFFGPSAAEVGGVVRVRDGDTFRASASFIAEQQ